MNIPYQFQARRSPVHSRRGMIATSQPLAVTAGLEMLDQGGSAADAAVAAAAALNVTEPTSTGLGGDVFALYYQADSGEVSALNASGRAPAELTLEKLQNEGLGHELPMFHPYTITVPGACAGWCDLADRFGRLSLSEIFGPAIQMAEKGFPVAPVTAYFWGRGVEMQLRSALNGQELMIEGRAPEPGEVFRNPGLARSLRLIAEEGKAGFYAGEIARAIVETVQKAGGCLNEADLAAHTSTWEKPLQTSYRGYRVWECPPNGQGLAALLGLNILEGFDIADLDPISAERLHFQIEAMRLAFADTQWHVSDPSFNEIPLDQLLSKSYGAERRKQIDPQQATLDQKRGAPQAHSDTIYLTVVDEDGNACSFINSNYMGFGTGIVPEGWGFTLQNRGHNFQLDPEHPNALKPGKRPYHTIIPSLITNSNSNEVEELVASYGVMGGFMQPQGHLQVACALLDDGVDPQTALDRPRFCILDGTAGGKVALEEGIPFPEVSKLAQMGHRVRPVSGYMRALFGRGQIIYRDPDSGVRWGGSDPRADGCALGQY